MTTAHRARHFIQNLVAGRDPFNINFCSARELAFQAICEAWSPGAKQAAEAEALRQGLVLKDHAVIGDYDLALWYTDKLVGEPPSYFVSLNNAEHNPLVPAEQVAKHKADVGKLPVDALKAQLAVWLGQYGSLVIGSAVPRRNPAYLKLLQRLAPEWQYGPFFGGYDHGFRVALRT